MAKLNGVNVVAESIVYGGATYVKTAEQAEAGDIIRHDVDGFRHIPQGAFFNVDEDDGGVIIVDEDGDAYHFEDDDEFTVFRRVTAETAAIPTKLPDTYVIHDGKVYVKEARKAEVGEKVVITKSKCFRRAVGSVLTAVRQGGIAPIADDDHSLFSPHTDGDPSEDYRVLVPTDTVMIDDAEYTLEKRTAAKCESALIIKRDDERRSTCSLNVEIGEVITIQSVDGDGDVWDIDGKATTDLIFGDEYLVLVPKQTVRASDEEVADATRKNVKVGDLIRVIDAGSSMFKAGDILRRYWDGGTIGCYEYPNGERISADCLADDRVEPVTPAEAEAARTQTEESAKWDAIGRKVGEIREGDVVRCVQDVCSAPVGTIGIAEFGHSFAIPCMGMRDNNGELWSFSGGSGLEVIAPAEQRFDRN